MLPLLNPVLSTSESEEEDDELPRIFFHDQNDVIKQLYEDEEADVVVIDSREINRMDECDNRAPSISRGVVSSEDKTEKNVNSSNDEKGKDDWEVYADNSSFWEDGQRLTDSWYGYEKVPDDGFDHMFIEGVSDIENNNNNNHINESQSAPTDNSEIPDDGVDNLLLRELINIENEESVLQRLTEVSVTSSNIEVCRNNSDGNVGVGGFSIGDDSFDKLISEYAYCF